MPTPSSATNTFYIAANIIFDLSTGDTKQVLTLVNNRQDATIFSARDAQNYTNFVKTRAQNIEWSVEPLSGEHRSTYFPQGQMLGESFIIKGVQYISLQILSRKPPDANV